MRTTKTTHDGVRIYHSLLLPLYDFVIMTVLSPYVWRCPPHQYLNQYRNLMSRNHADIGVGTGYVLDQCEFKPGEARIALFDLQQNCLDYTAKRLARFRPEIYQCDAMEPIRIDTARFDSIALGGIMHCIPGNMEEKGAVFDAIKPLMHSGTNVFGYTILNHGVKKSITSRVIYFILRKLNAINGFDDAPDQLSRELKKRFRFTDIKLVGCVGIFSAHTPI